MSDNDSPENESGMIDWGTVESDTTSLSKSTKTFIADLPSGKAVFEYEMVAKSKLQSIGRKYTKTNARGRNPSADDVEITDKDALNAEIVCEGIVDAPDGFPASPTKLKQSNEVIKEMLGDLADAITDFSSMDKEVEQKFR